MSFWEGFEHFYTGGGKPLYTPFSVVDPGWEILDFMEITPCEKLAALLTFPQFQDSGTQYDVYQMLDINKERSFFSMWDIVWDNDGNAGPGRMIINLNGAFSALKKNGSYPLWANYKVQITGMVSAPSDLFNFDPGKGRPGAHEFITAQIEHWQKTFGACTNFWIHYLGYRIAKPVEVDCCCLFNMSRRLYECLEEK